MNRSKTLLVFLLLITLIGQAIVTLSAIAEIVRNREKIATLERIASKQLAIVDWHSSRITQLERPDEPVVAPRHPGRIGSIDSPRE